MPDQEELTSAYVEEFSDTSHIHELADPSHWRTASRSYHRAILDTIVDHQVSGPIIDYGAGWGALCELLAEKGVDCWGVEPSARMARYCRERRLPVRQGDFRLVETAATPVSAVVMCSVFEHLVDHDAWLTRIRAVLRPGGHFITLQPTAACYALLGRLLRLGDRSRELPELHSSFNPPWHTALFSVEAMKALADQAGFELLEVRRAPQGRAGGIIGAMQIMLDTVNRVAWSVFGTRWPLITSHVFVMRKPAQS